MLFGIHNGKVNISEYLNDNKLADKLQGCRLKIFLRKVANCLKNVFNQVDNLRYT